MSDFSFFSTWLPTSYLAAKYVLGRKLPSTYLAAKLVGRSMFSTNSYSNDCQRSTWQPSWLTWQPSWPLAAKLTVGSWQRDVGIREGILLRRKSNSISNRRELSLYVMDSTGHILRYLSLFSGKPFKREAGQAGPLFPSTPILLCPWFCDDPPFNLLCY